MLIKNDTARSDKKTNIFYSGEILVFTSLLWGGMGEKQKCGAGMVPQCL
jgi:hypothetical protein